MRDKPRNMLLRLDCRDRDLHPAVNAGLPSTLFHPDRGIFLFAAAVAFPATRPGSLFKLLTANSRLPLATR